jgi:hypothetical protein
MASRKTPRKPTDPTEQLVPTLRNAVGVVDRALEELGQPKLAKPKRPRHTPPRKARKP